MMILNILKLAWRNILRNKRRTFFTIVAVFFGIFAVVFARSFIRGITASAKEAIVKTQAGHVKIAHKEYLRLERMMPKEHLVDNLSTLREKIAAMPGVTNINPQIMFSVMLNHEDKNEGALVVGIEPGPANKCMELGRSIIKGEYLKGSGLELVIGDRLARKMGVDVGDELLLVTSDINYSTYALPFKISGISRTGFSLMDKRALYIPLAKAQEMLDCGDAAHFVQIFLDDENDSIAKVETIKKYMAKERGDHALDISPWQENDVLAGLLPFATGMWERILWLIMFITGLVILNTMLMTVMERYHEIGVMKALGLKRHEVILMVMTEAFLIGVVGSALGCLAGAALVSSLSESGLDMMAMVGQEAWDKMDMPVPMFGTILYPDLTTAIITNSFLFGVIMSLLAVIYPALKTAVMKPVDAFRSKLNL